MSTTIRVQDTLDYVRSFPSLTAALGNPVAGYGGNATAIRIANKVIEEVYLEPAPFKWNRVKAKPFFLSQLQQDYSTSITNLAWMEDCIRVETDDPEFPFPSPPNNPIRGVEVVRDLLPTSIQGIPNQIAWLPNFEAICGQWIANMLYTDPAPLDELPVQPLTQVRDTNGNIQVLTTFGTTGDTAPTWPASTASAGTTTQDGTCVWTLQDPNGITFRISPVPPNAGIVYLIQPFYQAKPPLITSITQLWGMPDEYCSIYEQGFLAYAYEVAENAAAAQKAWALFQQKILKLKASMGREQESYGAYPGRSLTGLGGSTLKGDSQQYPPQLFMG